MAYEKLATTNYRNFGGINSKVSQYATGPEEVLTLINMDFQTPGSWCKRPGSTQFLSTGVSGRITGIYETEFLNGASYTVFGANTRLYYVQANAGVQITAGLQDNALLDFETFVDRLFFCNGNNFMKWKSGGTASLYGLPRPTMRFGDGINAGSSNQFWTDLTLTISWGYVNDRGFHGRTFDNSPLNTGTLAFGYPFKTTITGNLANGYKSIGLIGDGLTSVSGVTFTYFTEIMKHSVTYGLGYTTGVTYGGFAVLPPGDSVSSTTVVAAAAVYRSITAGGPRYRHSFLFFKSASGVTYVQGVNGDGDNILNLYSNDPTPDTNFPEPTCLHFTLFPRWLEIFNNQLFMAGFSPTPSVCWFSEIGEPETVEPTYNFEVRTNDGDRISGLKQYMSQLFLFKEKSFHALSGDNPDNFSLRQISDQYGCLSGRAIAVVEDRMFFLDKKGVAEYNGANVSIISNKIEPTFVSMNIDSAKDNAVMIHNRVKNQIMIGIPVNGSTTNNLTVVYDYLTNAWTTYDGFSPSSMAVVKSSLTQPAAFYGSYGSGSIYYFGASFFGDNGVGISCSVQTRFITMQESEQRQFRRLYLDTTPVPGASSLIKVDMLQDHGASTVYSTTMPITSFQSRIDFGISARCLSIKMHHFSATDSLVLHGFTIAHRFQRSC